MGLQALKKMAIEMDEPSTRSKLITCALINALTVSRVPSEKKLLR